MKSYAVLSSTAFFFNICNALPNILHLMADDMRPQLGAYGQKAMITPNIDSLAAESLVFDSAYTQFAYCAPSRNSFMTGRRPERTRCLNFLTDFRKEHGDLWVAMPQFFKNAGYFTSASGKLYHDGMDDPLSWSFPSNQTTWIQRAEGDICDAYGNYCAVTNNSYVTYTDEDLVLKEGLSRMRAANASGQPWWIGIGVHRPHWPSRLPQGFLGPDLYPGEIVQPPKHPLSVTDEPFMSGAYRDGDYKNPALGCPDCAAPTADTIEYRRWYYAAVTYADAMLGKALDLLDELGVKDNTIVVFNADHGYQLGELNEWSKKTNTELAVRIPLMIRVPWKTESAGQRTEVKAELVDLYRTLVDLAGLDASILQEDIQGMSLAPIFDNPSSPPAPLLAKSAFSQIGSCACKNYTHILPNGQNWTGLECNVGRCIDTNVTETNFDYMGYSMMTPDGWRYTAWLPMNHTSGKVDFNRGVSEELYDLSADTHVDFDYDPYSTNIANQFPDKVTTYRTTLFEAIQSWY
jgi:iduronate 2-sulfatase